MTNNALTLYSKTTDPFAAAKSIARAVASVVPQTSEAQGEAIALVCMCEGIHPIDFVRRYHWIPGKGASMRYDAMSAEFEMNFGGKLELLEKSPKRAAAKFTKADGKVYEFELTRRDLLLSRWPWAKADKSAGTLGWQKCTAEVRRMLGEGKGVDEVFSAMIPQFKDNYGTELDWRTMLWSRMVSDAIRSIESRINAGVYTPEEMADVVDGEVIAVSREPAETAADLLRKASQIANGSAATQASAAAANDDAPFDDANDAELAAASDPPTDDEVVDAEFTVTADEATNEPATGTVTRSQLDKLQQLRVDVGLSNEDWEAGLTRRGVKAAHSLTREQAQEMIDRLESRKAQLAAVPN